MVPRLRSSLLPFALPAALLLGASVGTAGTITGVCPDGSMFIVKRAADIPCSEARQVDPQDMPPIKPEFLPRPYAWQVHNQQQDPNNPYNLVEAARRVRAAAEAGEELPDVGAPPPPSTATSSEPEQTAMVRPQAPPHVADLAFSPEEIRDLFLIVELSQQQAPATFAPEEGPGLVVRVARSAAFDARLRELRARVGAAPPGPALLFTAVAESEAAFYANLTFVQGHVAFQPDASDPSQLGLIYGELGALEPQDAVLGYVLLPQHLDPSQPMDIYWNDRRLTATLP